jgi:hypothetical protein
MKLLAKQLTGYWFLTGALITIIIEFIKLYQPHVSSILYLIVGLFSGGAASYYFGYHYGYLIVTLRGWQITNWFKTIVYGWVISIATLYCMLFVLLFLSYMQTTFLEHIQAHEYLQLLGIIMLPVFALFATLIGCALQPVIIFGASALGALVLFLLRKKIQMWSLK